MSGDKTLRPHHTKRLASGDASDPQSTCCICYHPYHTPNTAHGYETPVQLTCGHIFGGVCISQWLQNKRTCPLCRAKVGRVDNVNDFITGNFSWYEDYFASDPTSPTSTINAHTQHHHRDGFETHAGTLSAQQSHTGTLSHNRAPQNHRSRHGRCSSPHSADEDIWLQLADEDIWLQVAGEDLRLQASSNSEYHVPLDLDDVWLTAFLDEDSGSTEDDAWNKVPEDEYFDTSQAAVFEQFEPVLTTRDLEQDYMLSDAMFEALLDEYAW